MIPSIYPASPTWPGPWVWKRYPSPLSRRGNPQMGAGREDRTRFQGPTAGRHPHRVAGQNHLGKGRGGGDRKLKNPHQYSFSLQSPYTFSVHCQIRTNGAPHGVGFHANGLSRRERSVRNPVRLFSALCQTCCSPFPPYFFPKKAISYQAKQSS